MPYGPEVIFTYIALLMVEADTRAGTDRTIAEDRSHLHTCVASIGMGTYLAFKTAQKALATIGSRNAPLPIGVADEFHKPVKIYIAKLQIRVLSCSPHGENGKKPPLFKP